MLRLEGVEIAYGDAPALFDVSVHVDRGELVAIVGPNGAGKTTLVNAIARLLPFRKGSMHFQGTDVTKISPQAMGAHGIAVIPEGRRLFTQMTVEENLDMGCYRRNSRAFRDQSLAEVYALFPILRERRHQISGTMSGGQQQMVAIARALMSRPEVLLIDEPSLGLAPIMVSQVFEIIQKIHRGGMSILLIEQNVNKSLDVAERAYVLDCGRLIAEGAPSELRSRPEIAGAYLGHASLNGFANVPV
ncbi:ABC transporter ATP-binding protein [Bradyrhizobium sp. 23AC]